MQLKRWDTNEVVFEMECESWADLLKGALKAKISFYRTDLESADLRSANLESANLESANLRAADLRSADLRLANLESTNLKSADLRAFGNMKELRTMQIEKYMIGFTKDTLQIGCKRYTIEEWKTFDDETISKMDREALEWWKKWKEFIFKAIELSYGEVKNER